MSNKINTRLISRAKKIFKLKRLVLLAKKRRTKLWLVGGFCRDVVLNTNKDLIDFDFCVEKNCRQFAFAAAKVLSGKCIVLDKDQASYRVVVKVKNVYLRYDFSQMRGKDFFGDVSLRDFTVNTLAVDISSDKFAVIDHLDALSDIRKKIIRLPQDRVLTDDPLRILRGFSLMAKYGFKLLPKVLDLMAEHKTLIQEVSWERINEELFKIINCPCSFATLKLMDKTGILDQVFNDISAMRGMDQGTYHHLDVWNHSLEAYQQFELLYNRQLVHKQKILEYLSQNLAQNRTRLQVLKLAVLLHDIGKPRAKGFKDNRVIFHGHAKLGADLAKSIGASLKMSANEIVSLSNHIFWHMRPGELTAENNPSRRAVYHFFRDVGDDSISVLLLGISDWRATCGPDIDQKNRKVQERLIFKLIKQRFDDLAKKPMPILVNGYDIMKLLKIKPSPLVGEIIKKIKEEQALGKIKTKQQALGLVKKAAIRND